MSSGGEIWRNSHGIPPDVIMRELPFMAHSIDATGTILNVTKAWANRLGYAPEDMIGLRSVDLLSPESRLAAETIHLPQFMRTGYLNYVHYDFVCSEGDLVPVVMSAVADSQGGKINRSFAVLFDNGITRRARDLLAACQKVKGEKATDSGFDMSTIDAAIADVQSLLK